jgi:hypothetical protein
MKIFGFDINRVDWEKKYETQMEFYDRRIEIMACELKKAKKTTEIILDDFKRLEKLYNTLNSKTNGEKK